MKKVSFLLVALLLLKPALAQSEKGFIAGTVKDQTGAVLKGAQVSVESGSLIVTSNDLGQFLITDLAPGDYTLKIHYIGFAPLEKAVTVVAGQTHNRVCSAPSAVREPSGPGDRTLAPPPKPKPLTSSAPPTISCKCFPPMSSAACRTPTWLTRLAACPASPWNATRAKENTCKCAEPSRA